MKLAQIYKKCASSGLEPSLLWDLYRCAIDGIRPEATPFLDGFIDEDGFVTARGHTLLMEVDSLIKVKAESKQALLIPPDKVIEFNQLWPESKLPTGYYGRSGNKELESAFKAFFREYPAMTDWDIILLSANIYLKERAMENWAYTKRSKYFIRRELKDKTMESTLAEYYERIKNNTQELPEESNHSFEPRVI